MKDYMLDFVSENTNRQHKEHLNELMLRYSILVKSIPELVGLDIHDIMRSGNVLRAVKGEAIGLLSEIEAHKLYFSSFAESGSRCLRLKEQYGSESLFLYSVLRGARDFGEGYCFVVKSFGKVYAINSKSPAEIYKNERLSAVLCIDLYEHSYFCDYGFNREEYLNAALSRLNLSKLS